MREHVKTRTTATRWASLTLGALVTAWALGGAGRADGEAALCAPADDTLEPTRWLRAASFDIRGHAPTTAEYEALIAAEDDGQAAVEATLATMVDEWLVSEAFAERFVRLHRELFWNNVSDQRPHSVNVRLSPGNSSGLHWARTGTMATRYRGANVRCLNEPARFRDDGTPVTTLQPDGSRREGYVEVTPYWAPDTTIRVCAFDAQDRAVSARGVPCNSNLGTQEPDCGCGPNLRMCVPGNLLAPFTDAMAKELELRVRDVVLDDRSYLDLFTSKVGYVNGPLVHFFLYQSELTRVRTAPTMLDVTQLPDIPFHETDTWRAINLGEQHAGILTSPSYLLRFQTDRARANRFFDAFLCQPFDPPDGGIPVSDEEAVHEPDLQLRAGCNYCHALLEPAAAHWGRWGERGMNFLSSNDFPPFDITCATCATTAITCPTRCNQHYIVTPTSPSEELWTGWLHGYAFQREANMHAIEEGPVALVHRSAVDGRLPRCVVRTAAGRLFGKDRGAIDQGLVDDIAQRFVASGFRYREVLKALVMHPEYRRVR